MTPLWEIIKRALERDVDESEPDEHDNSGAQDMTQTEDEHSEASTAQQRTVMCSRLGRELPGLAEPPFPGQLGQRIYENVSQQAWDAWQARQMEVINERGLSLLDLQARDVLLEEMESFLFGGQAAVEESAAEASGQHMVQCVKLGRRLPGLEEPPFPGELGQRVYENVSRQAWDMWQEHQTLVINHYGLNLADPRARELLMEELEAFLFEDKVDKPEDWVPEDEAASGVPPVPGPQGKGGAPGAPQSKGGGPAGPQRKG
jgi:Fe-S cluster biosynthesis and repair protein YggX